MPLLQSLLIMTAPVSKDGKNQSPRLPDLVNKVFPTPAGIFMRHTHNYVLGLEDQ